MPGNPMLNVTYPCEAVNSRSAQASIHNPSKKSTTGWSAGPSTASNLQIAANVSCHQYTPTVAQVSHSNILDTTCTLLARNFSVAETWGGVTWLVMGMQLKHLLCCGVHVLSTHPPSPAAKPRIVLCAKRTNTVAANDNAWLMYNNPL